MSRWRSLFVAAAAAALVLAGQILAPDATFAVGHTVTGVSPNALARATVNNVTITGTEFDSFVLGPNITVSGGGVDVSNADVVDETTITAVFTVASDAAFGLRNVTVSDALSSSTCTGCLKIGPLISSVSPNPVVNDGDPVITVTGRDFDPPTAQVEFTKAGFGFNNAESERLTIRDEVATPTQVAGHVQLIGAPPGFWRVRVIQAGSEAVFGNGQTTGLNISSLPLALDSVSPAVIGQGADDAVLTLSGSGLARGSVVTFSGTGVTQVAPVSEATGDTAKVKIDVSPAATTGPRDVTVRLSNGQTVTKTGALTIAAPPLVTGTSPSSRGQGASNQVVEIIGAEFVNGATAAFTCTGSCTSGITVSQTEVVSPTRLRATISVAPNATVGSRDVVVTNPNAGAGQCAACFSVTAAPTVTAVAPTEGDNTQASVNVAVTGTNFPANPVVRLEWPADQDDPDQPPVTMSVTAATPTQITGTFDLRLVAPGPWDVTVGGPDGGRGIKANGFTVNGGQPTVTSVTPKDVTQGTTPSVTVLGTNFADGAKLQLGSGITTTALEVVSGTEIDATLSVSNGAQVGLRDAGVTNTDGKTATCTDCLNVLQGSQPPPSRVISTSNPVFGLFDGGATVAAGDLDGDGKAEVVVGAGRGGGPHVRVFTVEPNGAFSSGPSFFPYPQAFTGGVNVAVGDVDGDGRKEIIAGAGPGAGPHVAVWRVLGTGSSLAVQEMTGFMAYPVQFSGGVEVDAGDLDGDGDDEIVTGAGPGAAPHVGVWNRNSATGGMEYQRGFYAYDPDAWRAGSHVAVGDFDPESSGAALDEIATGAGPGGGPHVRVLDGTTFSEVFGFYAYDVRFGGGVNVAAADTDGDTIDELVTTPGPGGGPHVRAWFVEPTRVVEVAGFMVPITNFAGGLKAGAADFDGDADEDLAAVPQTNLQVHVFLMRFS